MFSPTSAAVPRVCFQKLEPKLIRFKSKGKIVRVCLSMLTASDIFLRKIFVGSATVVLASLSTFKKGSSKIR